MILIGTKIIFSHEKPTKRSEQSRVNTAKCVNLWPGKCAKLVSFLSARESDYMNYAGGSSEGRRDYSNIQHPLPLPLPYQPYHAKRPHMLQRRFCDVEQVPMVVLGQVSNRFNRYQGCSVGCMHRGESLAGGRTV